MFQVSSVVLATMPSSHTNKPRILTQPRALQRIKNFNIDTFLDSKIAEEQARQTGQPGAAGAAGTAPKRSTSNARPRRGSGRTDSPSKRAGSRLRVPDGDGVIAKAPDPEDFVIGDEGSDISRTATPKSTKEGEDAESKDGNQGDKREEAPATDKGKEKGNDDELPEAVQQKLARLENLTSKYKGMLRQTALHRDWHLLFYSQNALSLELLRNYRAAHARVSQTEAFEATLREHTPLANVSDPGALVEFLNQRSLQSEMVMQELKRITGEHRNTVKERDELKIKLEDAEKKAKDAFDDAAGLREEREEQKKAKAEKTQEEASRSDPLGANSVNEKALPPTSATAEKKDEPKEDKDDTFFDYDNDLESQVKKHEEEIKQQRDYINELETENATLRKDVESTRLDLDAMKNKIGHRERENQSLQNELAEARKQAAELESSRHAGKEEQEQARSSLADAEAAFKAKLATAQQELTELKQSTAEKTKQLEQKAAAAEKKLQEYEAEDEKNAKSSKQSGEQEQKRMKTYQEVIEKQRGQIKETEEAKHSIERQVNDLNLQIKLLESEASSSQEIAHRLRTSETSAKSRAQTYESELKIAEKARDEAQKMLNAKKGHESAVASLRSQLTRAQNDRDAAYQMILNCGKCVAPTKQGETPVVETPTDSVSTLQTTDVSEGTEQTESAEPTGASTPTAEGGETGAADTKKKKKKKSKAKKKATSESTSETPADQPAVAKASQPTVEELVAEPSKAQEILASTDSQTLAEKLGPMMAELAKNREGMDESEKDATIAHHEEAILERDQEIKNHVYIIQARDETIQELQVQIQSKKDQIDVLNEKIRQTDGLREQIEEDKDELLELGKQATDAKHELKQVRESKQKLQDEFDVLQLTAEKSGKGVEDAKALHEELSKRRSELEAEIAELKKNQYDTGNASAKELQETKEALEAAEKERERLQSAHSEVEKTIEDLKAQHATSTTELEAKHKALTRDFEELKTRSSSLDTDLAAANELAQTRFKDLTDLKEHLNKVQPELKKLREESAELKTVKAGEVEHQREEAGIQGQ
jgi:chromosome segregation ATPase